MPTLKSHIANGALHKLSAVLLPTSPVDSITLPTTKFFEIITWHFHKHVPLPFHFCDQGLLWMVWKNRRMYRQNATVPVCDFVCHLTQVKSWGISPNCVQAHLYAGCLSNEMSDLSFISSQWDRQTASMALQPKGRVLSLSYYKKLKATNSLNIFRLFIWGIKTE